MRESCKRRDAGLGRSFWTRVLLGSRITAMARIGSSGAAGCRYGQHVIVPSTADLSDLFLSEPVSIAEISLGQMLPLERWPEGTIKLDSDVAGRRVAVCLSPTERRVTIDVFSPDLIASLHLSDVVAVSALTKPHGIRTMVVTLHEDIVTLRLRPEISVHYGAPR